jgi:hypothetical protein
VTSLLRKTIVIAIPLLFQAAGGAAAPAGNALAGLVRDTRALEAEIRMAGKPKTYFLVDARDSRLFIKAAGLTLKTIPIARMTSWGDPVAPVPRTLVRKSTLIQPKRPTINPEAAKKQAEGEEPPASGGAAADLDVLELKDMPARFRLELDQGLRIVVRPEPEGIVSWVRESVYYAAWYLARPLPTLWNRVFGKPYTALYLRVASQDARALYWACADGSELLIVSP